MPRFEIDFLTDYDDTSLLAELQRIAKVTGSNTVQEGSPTGWTRESFRFVRQAFRVTLRQALSARGPKKHSFHESDR